MKKEESEITINGITYIPKDQQRIKAIDSEGLSYVIIRTYSAGVFAGFLKKRDGKEVWLLKARRIWYWDGAASLSQLATDGTSCPDKCKFPCEVDEIILTEAIEIIQVTETAKATIDRVPIWKK